MAAAHIYAQCKSSMRSPLPPEKILYAFLYHPRNITEGYDIVQEGQGLGVWRGALICIQFVGFVIVIVLVQGVNQPESKGGLCRHKYLGTML